MKWRWFIELCVFLIAGTLLADIWWLDSDDYRVAANVSLVYVAVFTTVFTVRYAFWSTWWTSRVGPTYLALKIFMSMVLWQIVVATWWDTDFPGRQEIRFAIYSFGAVAVLAMINALVREQNFADDELEWLPIGYARRGVPDGIHTLSSMVVIRYLGVTEVAQRTGLSPNTVKAYSQVPGRMPQPDVMIGRVKGWLPETIDRWMERRARPAE